MGAAPGIAGSQVPEVEGVFLCRDEFEANLFIRMNNTGGPIDVWLVDGIESSALVDNGGGYGYLPRKIPTACLTLQHGGTAGL